MVEPEVPEELVPRGSGQAAPPRRPGSIRRTSTLDFTWADGLGSDSLLDARARDLITHLDGRPDELGEARVELVADVRRSILSLTTAPTVPALQALVGGSAMSGFRGRLFEAVPEHAGDASLLYYLLDDVPGASLVSGTAHRPWHSLELYLSHKSDVRARVMTDVCTGYQAGSSALHADGTLRWENQQRRPAVEVDVVTDPTAWHRFDEPVGVSMRRARRIDAWIDDDVIHIHAFFQDSVNLPAGGREAVHEYVVEALADLPTGTLTGVTPQPRVLPYDECPLAAVNTGDLIGRRLGDLRPLVLQELGGPRGCTHLNDMLRALADVPAMARRLRASVLG